MKINLFKIPVGDWSDDGHGECKTYYITANYPVSDMRQAYKDTCKKIGLQLNHSENYTDIQDATKHGSWRCLFAKYEESMISEKAIAILLEHGFRFERVDDERDENGVLVAKEIHFDADGVFDLFMWFISYSMPDDFEYEQVVLEAEPINGWWNNELNHQIGYGVF